MEVSNCHNDDKIYDDRNKNSEKKNTKVDGIVEISIPSRVYFLTSDHKYVICV